MKRHDTIRVGYSGLSEQSASLSFDFGDGHGISIHAPKAGQDFEISIDSEKYLYISLKEIITDKQKQDTPTATIRVELRGPIDGYADGPKNNKTFESNTSWHKIWPF